MRSMPARYHRLPQVHDVFAYTFAFATGVGEPLTFNPFTMRCTRAFTLPNITRILSFAEMVRTTSCVARSRITSWFSSVTQNRWLWDPVRRDGLERVLHVTRLVQLGLLVTYVPKPHGHCPHAHAVVLALHELEFVPVSVPRAADIILHVFGLRLEIPASLAHFQR